MKTKNKKLVSGVFIGLVIMAIGAVITTAQTDTISNETTDEKTIPILGEGKHGPGPFWYNLTEEQQTELDNLIITLREQNATIDEIQSAITEKLDEFGVLDTQLDNEIAQTEQRLTILNRQKELRDQGYSWNEINAIIQDEFDLGNMTHMGYGIIKDYGFGHGPCGRPHEFMQDEDLNQ